VGTLVLADGDDVDLTNLQRQILHVTGSVGKPKVESGREALARINPEVKVVPVPQRLGDDALERLVAASSVVLDCSDNFATRHAVNRACVRHRKPLVSGAAVRFDGQVSVFDLRDERSPCYHCLFPENAELEEMRCAVMGVFAPLTGIIGTLQAAETLKLLADVGETLKGRLMILDALAMQWRTIKLAKDPACPVCSRVTA
jgi:adenylyltransferase/sulfurtransferase